MTLLSTSKFKIKIVYSKVSGCPKCFRNFTILYLLRDLEWLLDQHNSTILFLDLILQSV